MATQAADVRSDRLVVLVTKSEKLELAARAKFAGMTVSDFVRTAAERFDESAEMSPEVQAEMLREVEQVKARMQSTFDSLDQYLAERREPDGEAVRAAVHAELDAAPIDWARFRSILGMAA